MNPKVVSYVLLALGVAAMMLFVAHASCHHRSPAPTPSRPSTSTTR